MIKLIDILFENNYPVSKPQIERDEQDNSIISVSYQFNTDDNKYEVVFNSFEMPRVFEVEFGVHKGETYGLDTDEMTGEGKALIILSTIANIINSFLQNFSKEYDEVVISGTDEKRKQVYRKFFPKRINPEFLSKVVIKEVIQKIDITSEQFIKRIPFLKTFKNFSDDKRVFFQKVDYNRNKQIIFGDEILTFPQVNTSIEFKYYKDKIGEKYFHNFILTFELLLMPPQEMDDLTQKVLILANNQNNKRLSYIKEVVTDHKDLSAEQLNKVINELNGKFFEIENYINQQSFDIKNPL